MWRLEYINEINKRGGGNFFCGGWNFSKSVSVGSTFIREMRIQTQTNLINLEMPMLQTKFCEQRKSFWLITDLKLGHFRIRFISLVYCNED